MRDQEEHQRAPKHSAEGVRESLRHFDVPRFLADCTMKYWLEKIAA